MKQTHNDDICPSSESEQDPLIAEILSDQELKRRGITPETEKLKKAVTKWRQQYPDKDLSAEFLFATDWMSSHRKRKYKSFIQFFNNWLRPKNWKPHDTIQESETKDDTKKLIERWQSTARSKP